MRDIYIILIAIVLFLSMALAGPCLYRHFGKQYAGANKEIHQESKSFVQGTIEHVQSPFSSKNIEGLRKQQDIE